MEASIDDILAHDDPAVVVGELLPRVQAQIANVGIDGLPEAARWLFVIYELVVEVDNGGFIQFLGNSSGDRVDHVRTALRQLGATTTLQLLDDVIAKLGPAAADPDRQVRARVLEGLDEAAYEQIEPLDEAFYEGPDDLYAAVVAHCRAHREAFSG